MGHQELLKASFRNFFCGGGVLLFCPPTAKTKQHIADRVGVGAEVFVKEPDVAFPPFLFNVIDGDIFFLEVAQPSDQDVVWAQHLVHALEAVFGFHGWQ